MQGNVVEKSGTPSLFSLSSIQLSFPTQNCTVNVLCISENTHTNGNGRIHQNVGHWLQKFENPTDIQKVRKFEHLCKEKKIIK